MRKSRFTEPQIVSILREDDAGTTFVELARKHGIHPNTVAAWEAKYGDINATELARSKAVEDENVRMRRIIANLTLENGAMKTLIEKTAGALAAKRSGEGGRSDEAEPAAACRITRCATFVAQYESKRIEDAALVERLGLSRWNAAASAIGA